MVSFITVLRKIREKSRFDGSIELPGIQAFGFLNKDLAQKNFYTQRENSCGYQ